MADTSNPEARATLAEFAASYHRLPVALRQLTYEGMTLSQLTAATGLTGEHITALLTPVTTRHRLLELMLLAERACLAIGTLPEDEGDRELTRDEARAWIIELAAHDIQPCRAGGAGPVPARARPTTSRTPQAADAAALLEMLEDYLARTLKYLRDAATGRPATASARGELTSTRYVLDYVYPLIDATG